MANDLIIVEGKEVIIPPAQHDGFKALMPVIPRLPQYFPPGAPGSQLAAAILAEANKKALWQCTRESVVRTALNCAVLGLIPGDFLGFAHFVPLKNNKQKCVDCQLWVGFKGWLDLAYDGDFLAAVHCEVVLRGEEFKRFVDESGPHFRHDPEPDRDELLKWANVLGVYCVWQSRSGGKGFEWVGRKALDQLKQRGNVWDSNPIAMALKTPIIRASKTWKRTRRLAYAAALEDAIEGDFAQPALVQEPSTEPPPPQLEAFGNDSPGAGAPWDAQQLPPPPPPMVDEAQQKGP